jgi:hypothetical protein
VVACQAPSAVVSETTPSMTAVIRSSVRLPCRRAAGGGGGLASDAVLTSDTVSL